MTETSPLTLLPDERRRRLVELLQHRGTARISDLADDLGVSVITVRRDVGLLAERGLVRRVRGGATIRAVGGGTEIWTETAALEAGSPGLAGVGEPSELTVGMVVPSLDYYWPDVIRGARTAAEAALIKVVLRGGLYQAEDERRHLARLIGSEQVRGLLVAPTVTRPGGPELLGWLQSLELPVVLLERTATVEPQHEPMESVVSDHGLGAATAVRYLATLGHRRIGVLTTRPSPTSPHVQRGWREACTEYELDGTPELLTVAGGDPTWPGALEAAIDQCLASGPTALLVHADREAVALVERCRVRGIRVPDDLAIITYDDEVATLCDPPLTAVRPPKAEIGQAAVNLLAARIRDPDRPAHRVVIAPRLIVRSSTPPVG